WHDRRYGNTRRINAKAGYIPASIQFAILRPRAVRSGRPRERAGYLLMPLQSMTGFAQVNGQVRELAFSLSINSVNHAFLRLHFRLAANTDGLEMNLRRVLKEKLARGHVDVVLSFDQIEGFGLALNKQLVAGYVHAFRTAAAEAGIAAEPDLNTVLRLPGAFDSTVAPAEEELMPAVLPKLDEALIALNKMRAAEGSAME